MLNDPADPEEKGILKDVNGLIDSRLGLKIGKIPRHRNETSCRELTKTPMTGFDALVLIADIYDQIGTNWDATKYHEGSTENWRLEKQRGISANNNNPEVSVERAIVNIPAEIWPDAANWFNQVPVASGLADPHEGGRRIDLVHDCGDNVYEFIELKIGSDTPLYAAMEILKYGVLYIFCRRDDRVKCIDRKGKLMQARKIHLRVLAPAQYYKGYDLSWLETTINNGLTDFLLHSKSAFEMDFEFRILPSIPSGLPVTRKAWT